MTAMAHPLRQAEYLGPFPAAAVARTGGLHLVRAGRELDKFTD